MSASLSLSLSPAVIHGLCLSIAAHSLRSLQIDKQTYMAHFTKCGLEGEALDQFERFYDAMDVDGNGVISYDEFVTTMTVLSSAGSRKEKLESCAFFFSLLRRLRLGTHPVGPHV